MPVVEVDNLRYRYPGRETLALDGISFAAESGQFLGVVGPNSSGKSTLCHALVGLVPHFYKGAIGGRVIVAGEDVHKTTVAEMSRRVGLVFQNPFTQMTGGKLTVYEEAAFGLEYTGVPRDEMMVRIEKALRLLGLWEVRDRSPFALSGGQMQRLAIASVLAMEPDVLVLDEPTSQLDPSGTREVFDAVAALCRQGMTVIMAEHKIELLAAHADRILVLHEGKLVTDDTPRNVFSRLARWAVAAPGAQHAPDAGRAEETDAAAPEPTAPAVSAAIALPPVTEAAAALDWTMPAGGYPVTLEEGITIGRERLSPTGDGGPGTASSEPDHDGGGHAAATEAAPVIQVRDVRFHYTPGVPVLKGITLDIGPGATAVIGQNGAGKSTFVRMLNGLLKPTAGDVLVNGVNTRTATVATLARTVGLVFQNPSDQLFKSRVIDEVMFGPMNLGVPAGEAEDRARAALAQVGLSGVETRNPYDLGLAERKLVTIASVLSMGTDVIILDEPTIGQDRAGVRRLGALVDSLAAAGRTVLTITHDMDFVARHFRRVLVFGDGRVLADGDAATVFSRPGVLRLAALEAPQITRLGHALALPGTVLTVAQFVRRARSHQYPPTASKER